MNGLLVTDEKVLCPRKGEKTNYLKCRQCKKYEGEESDYSVWLYVKCNFKGKKGKNGK